MTLKRILFRHLIVTLVADPDPDPTVHFDAIRIRILASNKGSKPWKIALFK